MRKEHIFKGGFEIGEQKKNFFAYQLLVVTEDFSSQMVHRLAEAVDREYKLILAEQFDFEEEKEVFEKWHQGLN